MITQEEMRVVDRNAEYFGVSIQELMENAGRAVAKAVIEHLDGRGKKVVILCGTGNNGGDGITAARYLKEDAQVSVVLVRTSDKISTQEAKEALERAEGQVDILEAPANLDEVLSSADIIVDGLLGIGASGEIKEPYSTIIQKLNALGEPILSIDVPSGLGGSVTVKPTVTLSLHDAKVGMTPENSGKIVIADIGIPKDIARRIGPGEFLYYPKKRRESHKGDNGRLIVVGGGPYTGAPAFVGLSAYRIGTDIVHIATPTIAFQVVASFSPNFIVHQLAGSRLHRADVPQIKEITAGMDAMVMGPGLGTADTTLEAIREVIKSVSLPLVLDADAITAVSKDMGCLSGKSGVITPHKAEFARLSNEKLPDDLEQRGEVVKALAKRTGFTILLKAPVDIVSDGSRIKFNTTHNPAMTVGGTGDALAGIVGGLLAKNVKPYEAARMAAFVNGYAGDLAFKEKSYGMMTNDLIEKIPNALLDFIG